MIYLIDGHNLLFAARGYAEEFAVLSEEMICPYLDEYFRRIHRKAYVVFDGVGPSNKAFFRRFNNIAVNFSGQYREADDILEEEIASDSAPKRLIVVSTDRRIKDAARRRKSSTVDSLDFWHNLINVLSKPERVSPEPPEKRRGLTESEAKYWFKLFGIDDQNKKAD